MKILVTGGAGFIGSSLIEPLLQLKHKVSVLDNLTTGCYENISKWLTAPNFDFIKDDMIDPFLLEKLVGRSDIVFHLAANPLIELGTRDPSKDYQSLQATYHLLEAMRKSQSCKRIVFTSTSAVYGEARTLPTPEDYSPLTPISLYGGSKLACEAIISGYCHNFDMSSVILRLANVIGSANIHGVVHDFIVKLSNDPAHLEILGNGRQNKSYLFIDDCIKAILSIFHVYSSENKDSGYLIKNPCKVQIFNLGSIDQITVLDIAKLIFEELSLKDVKIHYNSDIDGRGWQGDVMEYLLDCSKISAIGWHPKYSSREAVVKTVRDYMNMRPRSIKEK